MVKIEKVLLFFYRNLVYILIIFNFIHKSIYRKHEIRLKKEWKFLK